MLRAGQLLPPKGLSTLRFDAGRFPHDAGSLLPGSLATTPTGLAPAGEHELVHGLPQMHHLLISRTSTNKTVATGGVWEPAAGHQLDLGQGAHLIHLRRRLP
jgi:hypothetical protein